MNPVLEVVKYEEGFESTPYIDTISGYWHIGYGFNVDSEAGCGLPKQVADYWLSSEITKRQDVLIELFGPTLWVVMGDARQAALISMHYQLGAGGFLRFKKMISAIKLQDWVTASAECLDSQAARNRQLAGRFGRNARALLTGESQWEVLS